MKAYSTLPLPIKPQRWKEGELIYYFNHKENVVIKEDMMSEGRHYEAEFTIEKEGVDPRYAITRCLIDPELDKKVIENIEIEGVKAIDIKKEYKPTTLFLSKIDAIVLDDKLPMNPIKDGSIKII